MGGPSEALRDLLERERAALLAGDLDTVARLSARKLRLGERLAAAGLPRHLLEEVRAHALRNAQLLDAAREGARRAARALGPRQNAPLTTYGADGRAAVIGGHRPGRLTRQA
jgi:flagellar biosynthesis/type III secretory pathway chaperone